MLVRLGEAHYCAEDATDENLVLNHDESSWCECAYAYVESLDGLTLLLPEEDDYGYDDASDAAKLSVATAAEHLETYFEKLHLLAVIVTI